MYDELRFVSDFLCEQIRTAVVLFSDEPHLKAKGQQAKLINEQEVGVRRCVSIKK